MAFLNKLKHAARKRASYIRTRDELRALSLDVALDLDIDRGAADQIAQRAVYGG